MLQKMFKKLPEPIKDVLRLLKQKTYDRWHKKHLFKRMQIKHAELLKQLNGKEKLKVVFLAIHKSVWKVDPVFQKMLKDPFFEPIILVCPYTPYGEERMWQDMQEAYEYFEQKGYPLLSSYVENEQRWLKLEEIQPNIVFFTNPHDLTRKEYYEDAYLNYLSCYVPYFFLTTTHGNDQSIYNNKFHNAMWKSFMPHQYSMDRAKQISACEAKNCILTGYPSCEYFVNKSIATLTDRGAWKKQLGKKRIIFSPHHTIDVGELEISNFISIADYMLDIAKKYKHKVQWSFKPHPILKSKLFLHPDWGRKKTEAYYNFWEEQEYTQLDDGDYTELFLQSDAIIHDCGSFIAEYLFIEKPCAYLELNGESQLKSINGFGKYALESYERIKSMDAIVEFVDSVIAEKPRLKPSHFDYLNNYVHPMYKDKPPAERILEDLTSSLKK